MSPYKELNLNLTSNQQALKDGVHRIAKEVLRPTAVTLDRMSVARGDCARLADVDGAESGLCTRVSLGAHPD